MPDIDLPTCDRCVMRREVTPGATVITSRHQTTCPLAPPTLDEDPHAR